jgi:MYXO-CTERM domain-containing protein
VTNYMGGDTVTITIDEIIFHPGHYRVALSTDGMNAFPDEPVVTVADTPCGSAAIESPVVFPVLADGLFTHTEPFTAPQTAQITLPNMTCTNCTLQVIEFMGEHPLNNPGGCFYHHCANITITAVGNGGTSSSSTSGSTSGASASGASGASSSGVSSSASGASSVSSGGTTAAGAGGAGTGEGPSMPSGCKCSMPGEGAPASLGSLAVLVALLRRRRRG